MTHMVDVMLVVTLIAVGVIYQQINIKRNLSSNEIPYAVMVYLFAAPYRGLIAKHTPLTDVFIDLLFLVCFLILCCKRRIKFCPNHIVWMMSFMVAAILYSTKEIGLENLLGLQEVIFHTGIALLIVVITSTIVSQKGIRQIAKVFGVNASVLAIADIISFCLYGHSALSACISNRNFISIYELIGLMVLIYQYKTSPKAKDLLFGSIIMLDIIIMKSSSVYLGVLSIIGLYLIAEFRMPEPKLYRIITFVMILAVFFTIAIVSSPEALDNSYVVFVQNLRSSRDYTRTLIWSEALDLAKDNLIYGIGPDMFRDTKTPYSFPAHNDYVKVLVETGIIGVLGFVSFILLSIRDTLHIKDKFARRNLFGVILSLLIFILFHGYINYVVFWIAFCMPYWWKMIESNNFTTQNATKNVGWCRYGKI